MTTTTSRRAIMARAATLPALAVPAVAGNFTPAADATIFVLEGRILSAWKR